MSAYRLPILRPIKELADRIPPDQFGINQTQFDEMPGMGDVGYGSLPEPPRAQPQPDYGSIAPGYQAPQYPSQIAPGFSSGYQQPTVPFEPVQPEYPPMPEFEYSTYDAGIPYQEPEPKRYGLPGEALGLNPKEYADLERAKAEMDQLRAEIETPYAFPISGPRYGESALGERDTREDIGSAFQGFQQFNREEAERLNRMIVSENPLEVGLAGLETFPGTQAVSGISKAGLKLGAMSAKEAGERGARIAGEVADVGKLRLGRLATEETGALRLGRQAPAEAQKPDMDPVLSSAVTKLTEGIRVAGPVQAEASALRHAQLQREVGQASAILQKGEGREAFRLSKGALKGEAPKPKFEAPGALTPEEETAMYNRLRDMERPYFDRLNAASALDKIMLGEIPQRSELALLEEAFGSDLVREVLSKRPFKTKLGEVVLDVLNIPRTILASGDISFPLRQGIMLIGEPKEWASMWKPMLRAFGKEEWALAADDAMRSGKHAALREQAGLEHVSMGEAGPMAKSEEYFMSRLARIYPGVRRSERAFTTAGNWLRTSVFDKYADAWTKAGVTFEKDPQRYYQLADFLNLATGRGNLGDKAEALVPVLNPFFFAPRFAVSRPEALLYGAKASPEVRKIWAKNMAAFIGLNTMALSLVKLSGLGDVELDPRSSDFGKVRIGDQRIEFWGSLQPLVRYTAQFLTGQRKTLSGKIVPQDSLETLGKFAQSKLSPSVGTAVELLQGKDFTGQPLEPNMETAGRMAFGNLVPLSVQEVAEGLMELGITGVIIPTAGFTGAGVATFGESPTATVAGYKDELAMDEFGMKFRDLTPTQQKALTQAHTEIDQMAREARAKAGPMSPEAAIKEQAEISKAMLGKLPESVRNEMTRLAMPLNMSRNMGDATLNEQRFQHYQDQTAQLGGEALSLLMKSEAYKKADDAGKAKLVDRVLDRTKYEAKKTLEDTSKVSPGTAKEVMAWEQHKETVDETREAFAKLPGLPTDMKLGEVGATLSVGKNAEIPLTWEERAEYQRTRSRYIEEYYADVTGTNQYKATRSDEEKKKLLEKYVTDKAGERARLDLRKKIGAAEIDQRLKEQRQEPPYRLGTATPTPTPAAPLRLAPAKPAGQSLKLGAGAKP